ncbi:hypothetical protein GCM10009678_86400 [Actinomadura kijaniata]|uniref:Uncharacterized protein n=1 Tax=Actinomadura namibiensis TaxID=182080 RepID=A0A7W3M0G1_ACTNM|nr:hypothetical protein [Actinomadura namibiensis]MBA8957706.1 hypothetical protein [Actinomadura namibiensis]
MAEISELASIEFEGSLGEAFKLYGEALEEIADRWATELALAAADAEAAMTTMSGHLLLFGLDTRVKARRTAKRLKRAQEMVDALAARGDKFHRDYRKHFRAD